MNPQLRQFTEIEFSCAFRLPDNLNFNGCIFNDSCRSTQGSIAATNTQFRQVSALFDVMLNNCSAHQVISERMGITWFNQKPTFINQIVAIQDIIIDGISGSDCCSQAGSITANKGQFAQIFAAKSLDLQHFFAYYAFAKVSADLSNCRINQLAVGDNVRLTASHVELLIVKVSQKQGVIELNDKSRVRQILIVSTVEMPEIRLTGNGSVDLPLCSQQPINLINFLQQ